MDKLLYDKNWLHKKDEIIQFINEGKWSQAKKEVSNIIDMPEDILAILEAAIYEHENRPDKVFESVGKGLKYNYANYELYVVLGNYYMARNKEQAYLCYENAEFYCDNKQDLSYILQWKEKMRSEVAVRPVSIVIVSYNSKEVMIGCVQSIRKHNLKTSYQLVVVDNASDDGVAEWLSSQNDILLIRNVQNRGFGGGSNQGVKAASPENDIFFLNNDTVVGPNSIFWLRMGLYENDNIGAAGSVSNFVSPGQVIREEFHSVGEYMDYAKRNNVPSHNPYEQKIWLSGFAVLVKRRALDEVGLFDLRYGKGYYEDNDLGVRLQYGGYRLLLCRNSFIYHYGSQSFKKEKNYRQLELSNQKVFQQKWGFHIDDYTYANENVIGLIEEKHNKTFHVLEVGCGAGATLSRIQYLWPDAAVKGIEENEKLARIGANYLDIIHGSIESMELPYGKEYFDIIIMNHVLEKVYSPEKIVNKIKPLLKQQGSLIVGVFNFMHPSVLVPLLHGKLEYSQNGILDEKNIRYFTLDKIASLLIGCQFKIQDAQAIGHPDGIETQNQDTVAQICNIIGEKDSQLLWPYEYILKARWNGQETQNK